MNVQLVTSVTIDDLTDQLKELSREIEMRRRMYPRWVANERMSQAAADRQLKRLEGAYETVRAVRAGAVLGNIPQS